MEEGERRQNGAQINPFTRVQGQQRNPGWSQHTEHVKFAFGFDFRSHRKFRRSAGSLGQTGEETSELKPKTSPKAVSR